MIYYIYLRFKLLLLINNILLFHKLNQYNNYNFLYYKYLL